MDHKVFQRLVENTKVFDGKEQMADESESQIIQFEDELDFVVPSKKVQIEVDIPIEFGVQYTCR